MASQCASRVSLSLFQIHDGFFEGGPLIGSYCDILGPWEFTSSTNQLYLVFVTDQSVEMPGFEIDFEPVACKLAFH